MEDRYFQCQSSCAEESRHRETNGTLMRCLRPGSKSQLPGKLTPMVAMVMMTRVVSLSSLSPTLAFALAAMRLCGDGRDGHLTLVGHPWRVSGWAWSLVGSPTNLHADQRLDLFQRCGVDELSGPFLPHPVPLRSPRVPGCLKVTVPANQAAPCSWFAAVRFAQALGGPDTTAIALTGV